MRQKFSSGLPLEAKIGYSRAVRVGPTLFTSATAPVDDQMNVIGSTGYEQAVYIFQKLETIFEQAGFSFGEVVFARLYVANTAKSESAYKAFKEYLGEAAPAVAVINVIPWANDMILEIELTAQKDE